MVLVGDLYHNDSGTPPYTGFPEAFDLSGLQAYLPVCRSFIAAADRRTRRVVAIAQTPVLTADNELAVQQALHRKAAEYHERFPWPQFDTVYGSGTIRAFCDDLAYAWRDAPVEDIA